MFHVEHTTERDTMKKKNASPKVWTPKPREPKPKKKATTWVVHIPMVGL